ncbi:MAG TPA: PEP-CTERM sorting domain-containing protein [Verrucomicrobiota bacterium]|jgi:hypothetical protein|nr:PEP-CTERM sorting domain-containing protein [Verrucomicrobiota bacterium]HQL77328.1 PEP-CTERM sorting domain-containing protein [Verrucomicrobiota bacterium]
MKKLTITGLALIAALGTLQAQTVVTDSWTQTLSPAVVIPDDNPVGVSFTMPIDWEAAHPPTYGGSWMFIDVNVIINVSGGWNGDLYAHLSYDNPGLTVPLLNRVGSGNPPNAGEPQFTFGFSTAGFPNITLDDQATANGPIHLVEFPQSGESYLPDHGTVTLNSFCAPLDEDSDGEWTLFFTDLSGNFESSVLNWTVQITAMIPEPSTFTLGLLGLGALVWRRSRCRS